MEFVEQLFVHLGQICLSSESNATFFWPGTEGSSDLSSGFAKRSNVVNDIENIKDR